MRDGGRECVEAVRGYLRYVSCVNACCRRCAYKETEHGTAATTSALDRSTRLPPYRPTALFLPSRTGAQLTFSRAQDRQKPEEGEPFVFLRNCFSGSPASDHDSNDVILSFYNILYF